MYFGAKPVIRAELIYGGGEGETKPNKPSACNTFPRKLVR